MEDNITISLTKLFEQFPNEETAYRYLEAKRWKDGIPTCPRCHQTNRITVLKKKKYHYTVKDEMLQRGAELLCRLADGKVAKE